MVRGVPPSSATRLIEAAVELNRGAEGELELILLRTTAGCPGWPGS